MFFLRIAQAGFEKIPSNFATQSKQQTGEPTMDAYTQVATPKSPSSDASLSDVESVVHHAHAHRGSSQQRLKQRLTDELDIEILLKHREAKLIQREIRKVQDTMATMKRLHSDPKYGAYLQQLIVLKQRAERGIARDSSPVDPLAIGFNPNQLSQPQPPHSAPLTSAGSTFTITKASLRPSTATKCTPTLTTLGSGGGSKSSSKSGLSDRPERVRDPNRTSYGGIPALLTSEGKVCVHRLSSGQLVKLTCPQCGRSDFGSAQGMINHARLLHQLEFKSQTDVAEKCGAPLSIDEEIMWNKQQEGKPGPPVVNERKKRRNSEKIAGGSGGERIKHLKKMVNVVAANNPISNALATTAMTTSKITTAEPGFEELVKDVTKSENSTPTTIAIAPLTAAESDTTTRIMTSIDKEPSHSGTPIPSTADLDEDPKRRKSMVKFSDEVEWRDITADPASGIPLISQTSFSSSLSSCTGEAIDCEELGEDSLLDIDGDISTMEMRMTAAQRRRVPSLPNPLRTRSRSSRDNSN